eukprot:GEMP01004034.1.p1 GENE.GEMP01004034.1~~GEMP01004034.1.p1  ORF type:complete len:789 (+),score=117.18 GEMP01004034.1:487-2853(+)
MVFSWLYVGTHNIWIIFIIVLYMSKYGSMKLGKPGDVPEYSAATWFMMLFSCGLGNELFFYGVAEPVYHYTAATLPHRYEHLNMNERAEFAMTQTWFHFGLHGWVVYAIVGLTIAFMAYRKDLPLTMRSCMYPLMGDKVFGPIGDFIDMLSAVCTLMGVCTVLGLGVMDINSGLSRLSGCPTNFDQASCEATSGKCEWQSLGLCKPACEYVSDALTCKNHISGCDWSPKSAACSTRSDSDNLVGIPKSMGAQFGIIWVITAVATMSVVTGVKIGIRTLSITCFLLGVFLWLYVFLSDNPWYFLDVFCQQIGLYVQWIFQMGFHTDAFARHTITPPNTFNFTNIQFGGSLTTETSTITPDVRWMTAELQEGADDTWLDHWTIFYWGWWVAWSPFVGMFIAKISRGRTIREFIFGSMFAPMIYVFTWFCVFGSSGIKMERFAENAGLNRIQSPAYIKLNTTTGDLLFLNGASLVSCLNPRDVRNNTEACVFASRLSQRSHGDMWMDMIGQFGDLYNLMIPLSLVAIVLYFVTSADSGSLVIDSLCANGNEQNPALQKIYWSCTQGAAATALIYVGFKTYEDGGDTSEVDASKRALEALQAASLCSGLPYTILLCFMCVSLWKACQYDWGDLDWNDLRFFRTDLLDFVDFRYSAAYVRTLHRAALGFVAPTWYVWKPLAHLMDLSKCQRITLMVVMTTCFYLTPVFWICENWLEGSLFLGWICYFSFVGILASVRQQLRHVKNIDGNLIEDVVASLFLFGVVAEQLEDHFSHLQEGTKTDVETTAFEKTST